MHRKKRLECLLLAVVLLCSLVLPGLQMPGGAVETAQATVTVESTYASPGATVEVNLLLEDNPGIAGARLTVSYDEQLELLDAVSVGALSELEYSRPGSFASPCVFNWDSESQEVAEDGVMLTLTFRVSEKAKINGRLNVDVSCRYGDVYNGDLDSVALATVGGSVTVLNYIPGDVNGDGVVNGKDVTLLRRYNGSGYDVTINESAADVNNDGMINGKDVTLLRRYIAGGYDVKLQPSTYGCTHALEAVAAKAATCTEDGNLAYWYCADCDGYFSDAQAVNQITYEGTVQAALGHTEVIDPAVPAEPGKPGLTEGSHCSTCGKVLVAQQVTESLQVKYHAITYHNLKGAQSPEITQYSEHEGLASLPTLSLKGYTFKGWYTEEEGGQKLTKIPAGATQDYELWARWELIEYTITYNCGQGTVAEGSVTTYTVEDYVVLPEAELHYYFFDGWTDAAGAAVTEIAKGSTGNLTLTANWKTKRSQAKPIDTMENPLYEQRSFVVDGDQYTYIYYLGCIERVPFAWEGVPYEHEGKAIEFQYATSSATSRSIAETMYKVTENTRGWQSEVSVSAEVGYGCPVGPQAKVAVEVSHNQSGSTRTTDENGTTTTISQEWVSGTTKTFTMENTDPRGWYRWVKYATVDVFATVTYDASENKYYLANINAVRDISEGFDYTFKSAAFDDEVDTLLPFDNFGEMEDLVSSLMAYTEDLVFSVDSRNNCATVVGYDGDATDIVIPAFYQQADGTQVPVTGIKESDSERGSVFAGSDVTSITLGANIASIPDYAFYGCKNLTSVQAKGNLESIGNYAFYGCEALAYELPDTVKTIGAYAFAGCEALDRVVISSQVTKLGKGAFIDCGELDLTVIPADHQVLRGVSETNATNITIDMTDYIDDYYDVDLIIPDTVIDFVLNGKSTDLSNWENTLHYMSIESHAENTVIQNARMDHSGLRIYSPKVTLNSLRIRTYDSNFAAIQFYNENVELLVGNEINAEGSPVLVCNSLNVQTIKGLSANIKLFGDTSDIPQNAIQASGAVNFSGYMDVELSGGHGARGYNHGAAAISAKELTINIDGSFKAYGGNGGAGKEGTSYDALWVEGDGRAGGNGGTGGNGGEAIKAEKLTVQNAGRLKLTLIAGGGGRGGNGGVGESAHYVGGYVRTGGRGGDGGQGGNGGTALAVSEIVCDGTLLFGEIHAGSGGNGGNGGRGGHGDILYHWLLGTKREWSNPGKGGSGNIGGKAGAVGTAVDAFKLDGGIYYGHDGSNGGNGSYGSSDAL